MPVSLPCIPGILQYSSHIKRLHLHDLPKRRNKSLRQPEGEDEFGSSHQKLRCETLKERSETLILHHVGDNPEAALGVLKVLVLNAGLDNVERCRDDEGCAGTGNGCDKVL